MPKIQITAKGIRSALKKYSPEKSIVEYIWNGFDAQASEIKLVFTANEVGNIESLSVSDNGYGIDHAKLQEKFEPLFESQKALENKLKKNQSALHGKNGIGRLTFFTFARNASWKTVFQKDGENFAYEIYANAENINFYTGINAAPQKTTMQTGTTVTFTGLHGINSFSLEENFKEFLLKEFAWFLALNVEREFSISINGVNLEYDAMIADRENFEIIHEKTDTKFLATYIRWKEKSFNEASRYYYLDSQHKECWKEATAIKNKGEQFYHSVFIESPYFDSFAFQSAENETQEPLLTGTRSDSQFRFLRKKLASFLRIKRRPFLATFADKLIEEYQAQNIFPLKYSAKLAGLIKTLYEMQPRIFAALNLEQKKILAGILNILLSSNQLEKLPELLTDIIELTEEEKTELASLLST